MAHCYGRNMSAEGSSFTLHIMHIWRFLIYDISLAYIWFSDNSQANKIEP